ncbi:sulfotransferase 1C2A [Caerostris extrusa]|uniref:Sulfotransferase 1C2A n=1 Tax=Caerostris extrusa TaxID=172846 RepID=A0AAV4UZP2_CAEEX|nr:sulfotransferase 1C2A [Caerostris extrusa]
MNGLLYPEMFSIKCFQEALEYKHKPGDVFIDTYRKCGTTWMQNVAMYIFRKGKEMEKSTDFFKLAPYIDLLGMEGLNHMYEFYKSLKPPEDLPEFEEVRKGIVGDWRNHFLWIRLKG